MLRCVRLSAEHDAALLRTRIAHGGRRRSDLPDDLGLPARIREAAAELAASLGAVEFAALPPARDAMTAHG